MSHHEKILRGIIEDLMKVPMHGGHGASEGAEGMPPKEAHVEIMASGKPSELDPDSDGDMDSLSSKEHSHKMQMKKLHASSHGKKF